MRRAFLLIASSICLKFTLTAQTLDRAKQFIYYEKWNSAETVLKDILAAEPDAYYYLAELYMTEHKDRDAGILLQKGMDAEEKDNFSEKDHPLVSVAYAHWLLNEGKNDEEVKKIDDLLSATKYKNADLLMAAAKMYIDSPNGDINKALDLLDKAKKKEKKNADIYMLMGDAYRKQLDGSNAFKMYTQALELDPHLAAAHHKLGEIFKSQKNSELYVPQFTDAVQADKNYVPSVLELYNYYFYAGNFDEAKKYMEEYITAADPSSQIDYMKADLYYVTKKYPEAIQTAQQILQKEGDSAKPRLYKMIAYCFDEQGDSVKALKAINTYFTKENEKNYVIKDYELKASLLEKNNQKTDAAEWYQKALALAQKDEEKEQYMRHIVALYKETKDYAQEGAWREKIYTQTKSANNVDLFNWGVSLYFAGNYQNADSVFGLYATRYPTQLYGYLWRARCNAAIDTTMELGLAVPHYEKLIEVAEADKQANKSTLIAAYSYLGGYEANIKKDFEKSLNWFNKILEIDEGNAAALRYTETIKKWIDQQKGNGSPTNTGSSTGSTNSNN
ncbi:MAG TPA: tetratricopeptide repeat protein [Chitinophagaceae bacterium]|nr:tetratricopeptide repeat protein [Chitinophagaceae bacterium]